MVYRNIFLILPLLLMGIATAGPAHLKPTVRTPTIQRGFRKGADGEYFEFISKAQTQNPPPVYRIETGPNGHLWEVTIRKTIHTHEGRRRMIASSGSAQTAVLPRTQTLSAGNRMPQSCDCEPTPGRSTGECWYFPRKGSDFCMKRPCRLKFICTSRQTGLRCMLRKTTSKVVPKSNGKCSEERISGFLYAPYTSY